VSPTFVAAGLTEFSASRRSVGLMAFNCLAEFDNLCFRGAGGAGCDLLAEGGESLAQWRVVEGAWESSGGVLRLSSPDLRAYSRVARTNVFSLSRQPITVAYDVRITSARMGDNWAGVGVFKGNPGAYDHRGTACPALRYKNAGSQGLHLANAGNRWISESGQFPWSAGEWYRVEYTVEVPQPGAGDAGLKSFLEENVDLQSYERYLAAIVLCTHWDSTNQNYFFYRDDLKGDRWVTFPWDMDITWGYSRRKPPPAQGHNLHPYDGTRWNVFAGRNRDACSICQSGERASRNVSK
jgi:hypothetical protein